MFHAEIIGTGSYVPERVLTNLELEKMVDTSDEWIMTRTGIRERRIAADDETNVTMGRIALERAMEKAGIGAGDIDLIVVGTNTTHPAWPSAAGHIAHLLAVPDKVPFMDIQAGCTGFNYAVSVAELYVKNGLVKTAAVVGTDKLSAVTDYQDRNTCVLFGDGAGAVLLQRSEREGVIRSHLGGNARQRDYLILAENEINPRGVIWMEGKRVYVFAKAALAESCLRVLDPDGTAGKNVLRERMSEVRKIIPHQANMRIIQAASDEIESALELPKGAIAEKMVTTIEKYGNNSTASIPLALDETIREGALKKGDLAILVGFGAGLTYGANLIRL